MWGFNHFIIAINSKIISLRNSMKFVFIRYEILFIYKSILLVAIINN